MSQALKIIKGKPGTLEAFFWLSALLFFALTTPTLEQHFSLCAFHWLGFDQCPGCGIGRSMGFFLHGDLASSWQMHMLGVPATLFLVYRTVSIFYRNIKTRIS